MREHRLIHDRRTVDEPSDAADVGPRQRRIVEDARVLRRTVEQLLDELLPIDAERLGAAVDVEAVARFVLHLGEQRHLAPKIWRARDPVAFRQHADDLGVRVLRHHPDQLLAVALRHPVLGLDAFAARNARFEFSDPSRIVDVFSGLHRFVRPFDPTPRGDILGSARGAD